MTQDQSTYKISQSDNQSDIASMWYHDGYERLVRKYAAATDKAAIERIAPTVLQPTVSGMYRSAAR